MDAPKQPDRFSFIEIQIVEAKSQFAIGHGQAQFNGAGGGFHPDAPGPVLAPLISVFQTVKIGDSVAVDIVSPQMLTTVVVDKQPFSSGEFLHVVAPALCAIKAFYRVGEALVVDCEHIARGVGDRMRDILPVQARAQVVDHGAQL